MITSVNGVIDCMEKSVTPSYVFNESSANLLSGDWFIQQIGEPAKLLSIEVYCSWEVTKELFDYAHDKSLITVEYLDINDSGYILKEPTISLEVRGGIADRLYSAKFELAVVE